MNPLIWNDRGRWLLFSYATPGSCIQSEKLENSIKTWISICSQIMKANKA
jgi:hypothetical protein